MNKINIDELEEYLKENNFEVKVNKLGSKIRVISLFGLDQFLNEVRSK